MPERDDLARAEALLDLNRPAEAAKQACAHLAAEPDSGRALSVLARAELMLGNHREAVEVTQTWIRTAPEDADAHAMLSRALLGTNQARHAVIAGCEALRLAPHSAYVHIVLGDAWLADDRPGYARDCAREAVRLAPHDPGAHLLMGLAKAQLGDTDAAKESYRRVLELAPSNAAAMNNLAALEIDRRRLRIASRLVTSGLGQDPQSAALHHNHDAVWFLLLNRASFALIGSSVVLGVLLLTGVSWWARALAGVALVTTYLVLGRSVTRGLPRSSRTLPPGLIGRANAAQRTRLVLFGVATVVTLCLAFAPEPVALIVAGAILVALRLVTVPLFIGAIIVRATRRSR